MAPSTGRAGELSPPPSLHLCCPRKNRLQSKKLSTRSRTLNGAMEVTAPVATAPFLKNSSEMAWHETGIPERRKGLPRVASSLHLQDGCTSRASTKNTLPPHDDAGQPEVRLGRQGENALFGALRPITPRLSPSRKWQPRDKVAPNNREEQRRGTSRPPVQITPTFVVVTNVTERGGAPICSLECLGKWQIRMKKPLLLGIGSGKNRHCSHCSVCATAIRVPEDCALHGACCPPFFWAGTISAQETAAEVRALRSGPISDEEFEAMLSLLEQYPEATPSEIARNMIGRPDAP